MIKRNEKYRIIISGGGTGGHIYPALAIADRIREKYPDSDILFVGAFGKMEMQKVPEAGYPIKGIWISGFQRKITLKNLLFPLKLPVSLFQAFIIVQKFKPRIAIGVGGYASGPLLWIASLKNLPTLIQEQNSFPGITNRILGRRADRICVAYTGMEKYFPEQKITLTGNPVRTDIRNIDSYRDEACEFFNLSPLKKTLFVMGGSLGARTINLSVFNKIQRVIDENIQLIWQIGRIYFNEYQDKLTGIDQENIRTFEFLREINLAYALSDVVVSRAGALSISELCIAAKPCVFVPSPNVAEDHQTRNAKALADRDAAVMVTDKEAPEKMMDTAVDLIFDVERCRILSRNIHKMAVPDATDRIVDEIETLLN